MRKTKIIMEEEPYKLIEWFTKNYKNEIGAFGIGDIEDGVIRVKKLVFPKQEVTGVHVKITPENWGSIVQECSMEELNRICFYWHKHPGGCPTASQGDEEDTYNALIPEDSEREFFSFVQTAWANNTMVYEGRVELRYPFCASITTVEFLSTTDSGIEEQAKSILKTHVTEPKPITFNKVKSKPYKKPAQTTFIYIPKLQKGKVVLDIDKHLTEILDEKLGKYKHMVAKFDVQYTGIDSDTITITPKGNNHTSLFNIVTGLRNKVIQEYENRSISHFANARDKNWWDAPAKEYLGW